MINSESSGRRSNRLRPAPIAGRPHPPVSGHSEGSINSNSLISLLSFSPQDPGWSTQEFISPLNETQEINNTVGTWGAYISDFLYSFIGYMAFLIPIWLLYPVLKHFFFSKSSIGWPSFTSMQAVKGFGWALVVISG